MRDKPDLDVRVANDRFSNAAPAAKAPRADCVEKLSLIRPMLRFELMSAIGCGRVLTK